jgi:cell division protein FtsL
MTVTRGAAAPDVARNPGSRPAPGPARRPSARMSRAAFGEGMLAIAVSGLLLLGAATAAAAVTQAGYRLDHARHVLAAAQDSEHRLEVQVASLQAPARIAAIATSQLGMRRPSAFDTVRLVPVQDVTPPAPHSAVVELPTVTPGPGSVLALWDSLRTFLARLR